MELKFLDNYFFGSPPRSPLIVYGPAAIGKTELITEWFSSRRNPFMIIWLDASGPFNGEKLAQIISTIGNRVHYPRNVDRMVVVIDDSEHWTLKQHEEALGRILNYKIVNSVIFTRRLPIQLRRSQTLELGPLSSSTAEDLIRKLSDVELPNDQVQKAILASKGNPLAISLLCEMLNTGRIDSILSFLDKPLYDLSNNIIVPTSGVIASISPIIVSAGHQLISVLQRQPSDLRKLSPREFEQLLADLLQDMGWDVELTKQTRDGGADILAYLNTEVGRLLCLVEAKHYREDRKIGIDLVRTLYGTLCDVKANSAMLVTSSSFTHDAKEFQKRHSYQLSLRDYADVVNWILKFGSKGKKIA